MSSWFSIPLNGYPEIFSISLAGTNYTFTVFWNPSDEGGWVFNLANADTSVPLIAGAPFVTGTDLLAGLEYLGINGSLYVYTNGDASAVPTFTNLGTDSNLYFVTNATNN